MLTSGGSARRFRRSFRRAARASTYMTRERHLSSSNSCSAVTRLTRANSTTVTTVNGGVTSLVRTLVIELAPIRVNAIHNGIVGDSPQWKDMAPERHKALVDRTPIGRLVTMEESMGAARFLLENRAINGINLAVDGGWMCM